MKTLSVISIISLALIVLPVYSQAQEKKDSIDNSDDKARFYVNAGYITNIQKNDDCEKPDAGASIRVGLLTKKRLGFYVGYIMFKEYHKSFVGYDDEGYGLIGGIDFMVLRKDKLRLYLKAGLFNENFKSTYPNGRTEIETGLKPDFGLLMNLNFVNAHVGWQPSDPPHFNFGLGITF